LEKLGINLNFLIAQIVNFLLLLFILQRFLYKPVMNMLAARTRKVQESLAEADRVRQEAAAARAEYERQLEIERRRSFDAAQQAIQEGQRAREAIIAQAQREAEEIRQRAREEAERERQQMLALLRAQVADLAILASEKIIGQSLDHDAHRRLINEFLSKTEALN
jgi:F-type H+-transporting ATPase subunit b